MRFWARTVWAIHIRQDRGRRASPRGDRIGFGARPLRLREPPRLQRVHFDQRQRARKPLLDARVIRPCGVVNDPRGHIRAQPARQLPKACGRVGEPYRTTIAEPVDIQIVFRDVNSDAIIRHLYHVPKRFAVDPVNQIKRNMPVAGMSWFAFNLLNQIKSKTL